MKLFGLKFRNKETQTVEVYEGWVVRWISYQKSFSIATLTEQMKIFPKEEYAEEFVKALEDAQKLTKTRFYIEKYKDV